MPLGKVTLISKVLLGSSRIALLLGVTLVFHGCAKFGFEKIEGATGAIQAVSSLGGGGGDARAVFVAQFQPLTAAGKGNCVACHMSKYPSLPNPDTGYDDFLKVVEITTGKADYLLSRIGDTHAAGVKGHLDPTEVQNAINAVRDAYNASSGGGDSGGGDSGGGDSGGGSGSISGYLKSAAIPIPYPLMNYNGTSAATITATTKLVTIPLNSINAAFGTATVTFRVALDTAFPGLIRIVQLRGTNQHPTSSIDMQDMKVLINGAYDSAHNNYGALVASIPANTPAGVTLSTFSSLQPVTGAGDTIGIAFKDIKFGVGCTQLASFVSTVKPIAVAKCFGCHNSAGSGGTAAFSMGGTDAQNCSQWLGRSDTSNPTMSLTYRKAHNFTAHSGGNVGLSAADDTALLSWINSE